MLLDLHLAVRPRFTIIDGIIAMEGQGPGSGTPRELGSLFAAHDCRGARRALADRTAHERRSVYTMAASARRGLVDLDDPYRLAGDPIEPDTAFKPVRRDMQELLPPSLHRAARNLITARPRLVDAGRLHALRRVRGHLRRRRHRAWTRCPTTTTRSACAASPAPRSAPRRPSTTSRRRSRGCSRAAAEPRSAPAPCRRLLVLRQPLEQRRLARRSRSSSVPVGGALHARCLAAHGLGGCASSSPSRVGLVRLLGGAVVEPVRVAVLADLDAARRWTAPSRARERVGVAAAAGERERRRQETSAARAKIAAASRPAAAACAARSSRRPPRGTRRSPAGRRRGRAACWCPRRA